MSLTTENLRLRRQNQHLLDMATGWKEQALNMSLAYELERDENATLREELARLRGDSYAEAPTNRSRLEDRDVAPGAKARDARSEHE